MSQDEYLTKLTQILSTVQAAGIHISVNARTENSLNDSRKAWCLLLKPEIPLGRLESTILATIKEKCDPERAGRPGSLRALAASDVLRHWRGERHRLEEKKRLEANSVRKPCSHCGGTFKIRVYNPLIREDVIKDCPFH